VRHTPIIRRSALAVALGSVAIAPAIAASPATAASKKTITLSGSTSVYPLANALTKKYARLNKKVRFRVAQGGSDKGITDAARGRVTLGMSSRDPRNGDPKGLNFYRVAKDAVCIITNSANPVGNLSQQQIADIFSGKIRSWSEVPGATQTGTIAIEARNEASGTLDAFERLFLGDATLSNAAARRASNGLIQAGVKRNPQAIGFVSLEFLSGVHTIDVGGVACTTANAKSGRYAGTRNFWLVAKGKPKGETARFITWIQKSKAARKIVVAQNQVPLK